MSTKQYMTLCYESSQIGTLYDFIFVDEEGKKLKIDSHY